MARGGPGQNKGGQKECKVCSHPGRKQIEVQLLNDTPYATIISQAARDFPQADVPKLTKPNLTNHKNNHLLTQPITRVVEGEGGEVVERTYLTGHYEAKSLVIPNEAVPTIPDLPSGLRIIIAAALHNALTNPALVTIKDGLEAMKLLKQIGGGQNEMDALLGSWEQVEKTKQKLTTTAKTRRRVIAVEETSETTTQPAGEPARGETIDAEWSAAELDNLALPAPGSEE